MPVRNDDTTPAEHAHTVAQLQSLSSRAAAGDPTAQRDLGCAYIWGKEGSGGLGLLPVDLALARHWYVLAAEQGHFQAMWDVSHMLLDGEGGTPDHQRGLRYLHHLASRRYFVGYYGRQAAECLANYYTLGQYGLCIDPEQAAYWAERIKEHQRYWRGYRRRHHG